MKRLTLLLLCLLPIIGSYADNHPQSSQSCPEVVQTALQAADALCEATGRNQVCYGNIQLEAVPQTDVTDFQFSQIGDIEDVTDLASLRLSPMDTTTGEWGVALMRLQANLPDTLPGQNVTFILFGDVELTNAVTQDDILSGNYSPMQAFYLRTGIGDAQCEEAPQSGMLVQTPEGVGQISFVINEIEVQLGSTAFFQAGTLDSLQVATLEGAATLKVADNVYPVVAGTRYGVELLADSRRFVPVPDLPTAYEPELIQSLPLGLLDRPFEVQPPLDKNQLEEVLDRLESGKPLCGDADFLPSCDHLSEDAGGTPCIMPDESGNYPPGSDTTRPLCDLNLRTGGDYNWCVVEPGPDDSPLGEHETRPICPPPGEHPDCIMPPQPGVEPPLDDGRPFCNEIYHEDDQRDDEHRDDSSSGDDD
ncbi:MAG: hypothetical protein CUN56_04820 [Phototrophicales bacterium]|nr:MAG: hypothetical protein CUN56_04820 [Phototrophicales bacterium]